MKFTQNGVVSYGAMMPKQAPPQKSMGGMPMPSKRGGLGGGMSASVPSDPTGWMGKNGVQQYAAGSKQDVLSQLFGRRPVAMAGRNPNGAPMNAMGGYGHFSAPGGIPFRTGNRESKYARFGMANPGAKTRAHYDIGGRYVGQVPADLDIMSAF